jgi:SAM-dependent methyltransferase
MGKAGRYSKVNELIVWGVEGGMSLVLLALAVVMVVHGYYMIRNRVPYVVLPEGAMRVVAEKLAVRTGDTVYDLGCGDGRVIVMLQKQQPGAKYVGVENDWIVWLRARWTLKRPVRLVHGEISQTPLAPADRVFVYLGPEMMAELEPRFERELKSGSRVVSVQFPLPHRRPDETVELPQSKRYAARLFVYNY